MSVTKAVIPAAGWGTRFLPVSKVVPKEALPIIDTPVIQYAIEEAAKAGITQVILVTSQNKRAVEDYFDRSHELEALLEGKGDEKRLAEMRRVMGLVEIHAVRQRQQLGLGHAVLTARRLVGNEPFAVFLPDDVVVSKKPAIAQLMAVFERRKGSVLAVTPVPESEVSRYGVIEGTKAGARTYRLKRLVEKPRREDAPSNLAVIGRYVLTPEIFEELERVKPGAIGEIQLTDAIDGLIKRQPVFAVELEGELYDAGTPLGLLKASVAEALRRPEMAGDLRHWLRGRLRG
ncbi:MAG: UTP--glucose-1-phosphate uridylyltransferase GalU [Dehalococcoidia bacterium]|nr:UTP--glucose-1-phosphate uridylyltransferase GalU [Dehalococcoidia bacterium]